MPGQGGEDGRPDIGGAAEAVDHQDALALAVALDGHALDELGRHAGSAPQAAGRLQRPRAARPCGSLWKAPSFMMPRMRLGSWSTATSATGSPATRSSAGR